MVLKNPFRPPLGSMKKLPYPSVYLLHYRIAVIVPLDKLVAGTPFKCPAAPYEAATLLDHDLRKRKLRNRVSVAVYSPEPGPMGVVGPVVSAGVRQLVEQRDIAYYPRHQVVEADPESKTLRFSNGAKADFDFLV